MSRKLTRIAVLGVLLSSVVIGVFSNVPRASAAAIPVSGAGAAPAAGWMKPDGHWHSTVENRTMLLSDGTVHSYQVGHSWRAFTTSRVLSRAEVAALMASPDTANTLNAPTPDLICTSPCGGGCNASGVVDVYNQWWWADLGIHPRLDRVETQLHSSDSWDFCNNTIKNNFLDGQCDTLAPNATCDSATGDPHVLNQAPSVPQSAVDAADFKGALGGINGNYFCHTRTYVNAAGSYNFNQNNCS